jgi:hypothetical protein
MSMSVLPQKQLEDFLNLNYFYANAHNYRNQLEEILNMANNQQKIKDTLSQIEE